MKFGLRLGFKAWAYSIYLIKLIRRLNISSLTHGKCSVNISFPKHIIVLNYHDNSVSGHYGPHFTVT